MDPDDDGWQKVLPRVGGEKFLSRAELEARERKILKEWEASKGHWSGIGKHTPDNDFSEAKKLHYHRFKRPSDKPLGSGSFGDVEKVHYVQASRTICVARKQIRYQRRRTIQMMREEAHVMEKLDHEHIVKLVGTYCIKPNELFILLWPVAVCNLEEFFNDLDALKGGHEDDEILGRLESLELSQSAKDTNSITNYLQQLIGCIARAVAYCHEANIRHLDLKPSNILLNPGRVYLADFGIARDVHDRDCTMTIGPQGTPKWRAPEILNQDDEWSMKAADVYSLGLILLNIATVLYGADLGEFDAVIGELSPPRRADKLKAYIGRLEPMALATQTAADPNAPTFAPRHIVHLTSKMVSFEASQRPVATQVDAELVELGGLDQIYHSSCCKRSSRYLTERMSNRLKMVADGRNQLLLENQKMAKRLKELEDLRETVEERIENAIKNERKYLQKRLDTERAEREKAEALVEELKRAAAASPVGRRSAPTRQSVSKVHVATATPSRPTSSASQQPPRNSAGLFIKSQRPQATTTKSSSPLPTTAKPQPRPKASSINTMAPAAVAVAVAAPNSPQPSYLNQTVSSANRTASSSSLTITSSAANTPGGPLRRVSTPRTSAQSLHLASAVNPTTPVRSGTPATLSRDPSATDSTQFSIVSSTFSRRSGHSLYSGGETSVGGTPALEQSPFGGDKKQGGGERRLSNVNIAGSTTTVSPESTEIAGAGGAAGLGIDLGLGIGLNDTTTVTTKAHVPAIHAPIPRRESMLSDRTSIASPVLSSAGGVGPGSVVSSMSSPQPGYAVLDSQGGQQQQQHKKVPRLVAERSWAEVLGSRSAAMAMSTARPRRVQGQEGVGNAHVQLPQAAAVAGRRR